jgi:hypothetical protein
LAALSQFIFRLAERTLPFFKLLRKSGPFIWTDEAEEAFQELKRYLTSPPVMVSSEPGEPLLLYIAAIAEAVSMVDERYLTSPPVLVDERSEPPQPQETKEASTNGSGSQGPESAGSPEVGVAAGSQLPEASLAPERQAGPDNATGSQPLEASSGPGDLESTAPRPPRHFWVLGATGPQGLSP